MKLKHLENTLEDVKKRIIEFGIKVDGTSRYDKTHKHSAMSNISAVDVEAAHAAVLSISVPREFFLLWERYLTLCKTLSKAPKNLIVELNERAIGTSLNCQSLTLNKRINTEVSRFLAKYKKLGGAKRKIKASKCTNIVVFKSELEQPEDSALKQLSLSE